MLSVSPLKKIGISSTNLNINNKWIELETLQTFDHAQCDPIYYYSIKQEKEYIIISPHYKDKNNCYIYDIDKNKFNKLTDYPNNFSPSWHLHIIDQQKDKYYIFGGIVQIYLEYLI